LNEKISNYARLALYISTIYRQSV